MAATSTTVRLFDLRASQKAAASLRPHEQQPLVSSSPCSSSTGVSHDLRRPRHGAYLTAALWAGVGGSRGASFFKRLLPADFVLSSYSP